MSDWKQFENESTLDLIEYIRWKDQIDYKEDAEASFIAFCFRFRQDLIKKCEIICKRWSYDLDTAILLANRTFEKFWKNPNYRDDERKTAKTTEEGVKLYLYGIAKKELVNIYRENEKIDDYTGEEKIIWDFPDIESLDIGANRKRELLKKQEIVDLAMARLTEKHKVIYLTYSTYEKEGRYLPKHLLKRLQEELRLGQETIRFYKYEANIKIKDYLEIWEKANIL